MKKAAQNIVQDILSSAGITLNGNSPKDIQVRNDAFYQRVLRDGSLGLGESYMDGWWECASLDELLTRVISAKVEEKIKKNLKLLVRTLASVLINRGNKSKAFQIGERHYDIGNDLYRSMLDPRMVYSCAYWKDADNLHAAQAAKLDLICRKLDIRPGNKILDIGWGWGSFARYAAERYGASVIGVTVSKEQMSLGRERCRGLPVEMRLQDYRDIDEPFDHIVSIGMFEHVGFRNYRTYMKTVHRCLKNDGLFLLHTIGRNETEKANDEWLEKYIFPNSLIPSMKQISAAAEKLFVVEDWHNIGCDYDRTLMSWFRNFNGSWESLKERYGDRFYRMWKYYLLSSAAAFRSRHMQVWQIVLSKEGVAGGYRAIR